MAVYFFPLITALAGYWIGSIKHFSEEKQKAYRELLPPIIKFAYDRKEGDEIEFHKALTKLWLYASKSVAQKMENALSIIHDGGNPTPALQETIADMRKDIQRFPLLPIWPWQKLEPKDINHIYTKIK